MEESIGGEGPQAVTPSTVGLGGRVLGNRLGECLGDGGYSVQKESELPMRQKTIGRERKAARYQN